MKKPTFLAHYNCQINPDSSRLLIAADCMVIQEFVNVLCDRLNTNADLLYIDTSRKTPKNVVALPRHFSYLIVAKKALSIEDRYENIIFWQQFIGLYWSLLSYLKIRKKIVTFLLPLIYKPRKGIIGKIFKLFFSFSLSNPALWGAICYSSEEQKYYQRIFPNCKSKIFFIPYGRGQSFKTKGRNIPISRVSPYFFSGGTSNRDYSTLISAAEEIKYAFVIACTPKDTKGLKIPDNVRVFHNAYGEKFDSLLRSSYGVILPLKDTNISSGQIVLLKAMEMGKPIVATRSAGTIDYVDESCAFLVEPKNVEKLKKSLKFVIKNPEKAQIRATKVKKRYQEKYSIQKFASSLTELINHKNKIRTSSVLIRYCDCCNEDQFVTITLKEVSDSKKAVQKKYSIVTCKKCSHSFIAPMPSKKEIVNFYPEDYYAHVTFTHPNSIKAKLKLSLIRLYYGQYSGNKFIKLLQNLFYLFFKHTINEPPIIANGKLLDIGCGNGEYLNMVRQFGWDIYGIELNENAVNITRSIGLRVKKGTAEKIEYKDDFFDVVRVWNVLEHTISPRKTLLEIVRVLKKGRYLLVYVPNFNSLDRKYFDKYWASLEVPRHLHHFSAKSLESYLEKAGTVIELRMYPGTIFSMLGPTIKIMRGNKMTVFSIAIRVTAVIVEKIYNRLLGRYSGDVGITLLARKV